MCRKYFTFSRVLHGYQNFNHHYKSCQSHAKATVARRKPHNSNGCIGLTSDHLKHAGNDLVGHIALLFISILIYGTLPENFTRSTR